MAHGIVEMAYCNIHAGSGLVCLGVVNKHGLQTILQSDEPVIPVILLRLYDRFRESTIRRRSGISGDILPVRTKCGDGHGSRG